MVYLRRAALNNDRYQIIDASQHLFSVRGQLTRVLALLAMHMRNDKDTTICYNIRNRRRSIYANAKDYKQQT